MSFASFSSLILAAATNSMVDGREVDAFVAQVYAPYHAEKTAAPWDRAIWSGRTQALLNTWKHGRASGEADKVSDSDMLCDCQDWDADAFRIETQARQFTGPGRAVVLLRVLPDGRHARQVRLALVKEQGRWLIDELGDPGGRNLSALLRQAIAR
ncbi:MAG: DUF3828 domain-containing protein [Sphingomonadales bacterium]|nr:DUF3828 domain-containing protein [Sphingomonadales bacterium]MDE2168572.1 DUF3828 domain-containing protein [Sphingomonadales bacterium]